MNSYANVDKYKNGKAAISKALSILKAQSNSYLNDQEIGLIESQAVRFSAENETIWKLNGQPYYDKLYSGMSICKFLEFLKFDIQLLH